MGSGTKSPYTESIKSGLLCEEKMKIRKLILAVFTFLPIALYSQALPGRVQIDYNLKGSVPPVSEWYDCINSLRGKPFDRTEADKCLQSILSRPHLTSGRVIAKPEHNYTQVSFILESPPLALAKVDFGLSRGFDLDFAEFINRDEDVLHTGDIYDSFREAHTAIKLDQFLKAKGVVTIVSKDVVLDYDHKTASLLYKISEGPSTIEEEPLLPNGKKCELYVKDFSEIDIDDYTPLPLVNSILAIRRTPCFSSEAVRRANQELENTGLFSLIRIKTTASGEWRNVSLSAQTKPTIVKHIVYKWYGAISDAQTAELPPLPLAESQVYRRSHALGTRDVILGFFSKSGLNAKVYEEDTLEPDHELTVVFHVLGAKADILSIDGRVVQQKASAPMIR
jgi:hypothetical protein